MDFIVKETGERKHFSSYAENGTDAADAVAISLGILGDDEVTWDGEENAYIASEEVVEDWLQILEIYDACEEELDHLRDLYGNDVDDIYREEMAGYFDIDYFKDAVEATKAILQKRYDTATAHIIAHYESKFQYSDFRYFEESLYQQDDGSYFITGEGGPMTQYGQSDGGGSRTYGEGSYSVTAAEAKKWFKECFGKETDEIR